MMPAFSIAISSRRLPRYCLVVIVNVRNDRHPWIHDVGRVQTASQADLQHCDIHVSLGEVAEADGSDHLKVGGMPIQPAWHVV